MAHADKRPKSRQCTTLPDDLLTNVFQFAVHSLREWGWLQSVNAQFRTCARKARALSFARLQLQEPCQLNHLGPMLNGVSALTLRSGQGLETLPPMLALKTLNVLGVMDSNVTTISHFESLRHLFVSQSPALSNQSLHNLSPLSNLQSLSLFGCATITDLAPVSGLTQLEMLGLDKCASVSDLSPLSALTSLTMLSMIKCASVASLDPLVGLCHLRKLNLFDCKQLSDASLHALSHLSELRTLVLAGCSEVGDVGLRALANLQLVELRLAGCYQVTMAGLQGLRTTLRRLDVHGTRVSEDVFEWPLMATLHQLTLPFPLTDAHLASMSRMVELTALRTSFPVTDAGLAHVSRLVELKALDLWNGERITDPGFEGLSRLVNLTRVHLRGLTITDASACTLASFVKVRQLRLTKSDTITCDSMRSLRPLTNLTSLDLSECCHIADQGLEHLSSLVHVRSLELRKLKMSDQGLAALSAMVRLTNLDLSSCKRITGVGLRGLASLGLQSIVLDSCCALNDEGVRALAAFQSLQILDLSNCDQVTDQGWQELPRLKTLEVLHATDCKRMTDHAFVTWRRFALHYLNLSGCCGITDQGVRLMGLPVVSRIILSDCDLITDDGLRVLSTWSALKNLDVSFCDRITNVGLKAVAHIKGLTHVGCFGVSAHEHLAERIIEPNLHVLPINDLAVNLLVQALFDFTPRESGTKRCIHIDTSQPNHLVLLGSRASPSMVVPVAPREIDWALVASHVASQLPPHNRWAFFLGPRNDIRVHARPLDNRWKKRGH